MQICITYAIICNTYFFGKEGIILLNDFTIEDDGLHTKLMYHLSEDEEIDAYCFRMIEAAAPGWLVPLAPCDGTESGVSLGFDITDMTPVSLLASNGAGISFIADIFGQVISAVYESEKYLFDSSMFVLNGDYVYYHRDTGQTKLLLLPERNRIFHQSLKERLREFIKKVLCDSQYLSEKDGIRLIQLLNYINNEREFTVKGLADILNDIRLSYEIREEKTEDNFCGNISEDISVYNDCDSESSDNLTEKKSLNVNKLKRFFGSLFNSDNSEENSDGGSMEDNNVTDIEYVNIVTEKEASFGDTKEIAVLGGQSSFPYMVRKCDGSKVVINKTLFSIGKEERYADYRIIDNAAVSRMHAEIKCENGVYAVIDQDSRNHTYINGDMAGAYVPVEIHSGDVISFADDEYTFYS